MKTNLKYFMWNILFCFIILIAIWFLWGEYSDGKRVHTDVIKRVKFIETFLCIDVPSAECRPSLGQQCMCD